MDKNKTLAYEWYRDKDMENIGIQNPEGSGNGGLSHGALDMETEDLRNMWKNG